VQKLRTHDITLESGRIVLRPMTEDDWDLLLKWNSDPGVLHYSDGNDVSSYSLEEVQDIYRCVSRNAFCFIIELDGKPIGEGWLQRMNLDRILKEFPDQDLRRIDLMIGEKQFWGQGIGTEVIRLLTEFGFEHQHAEAIFGCGVGDYNPRSRRAFEKNGYTIWQVTREPDDPKAKESHDLILTKGAFHDQEGRSDPLC